MIKIQFVKTHPNAQLPKRNTASVSSINVTGDTGYDIFAVEDTLIPASHLTTKVESGAIPMEDADFECTEKIKIGSAIVPVGLKIAFIEPGWWFKIEARSGMGFKHGIQPHFGIIDNLYRGSLDTKLYNLTDKDYQVKAGDRIAQIVFYPIIEAKIEFVDKVVESIRGEKGFGSSGK